MKRIRTMDDAKEYAVSRIKSIYGRDDLNENDLGLLLQPDYKEERLSILFAMRPLIDESVLKRYDYNEFAIFQALFLEAPEYTIPRPDSIPDYELSETEFNWYNRLMTGGIQGIQAAHTLVNNNSQVNLTSIKKIYCHAVNKGYTFDDDKLIQTMMILAAPFLSDKIKEDECFDTNRIFYKTFLPEYYNKRYKPLDYLDILYPIKSQTVYHIIKKAEIKDSYKKWCGNRNGIILDQIAFKALNAYMDAKGMTVQEKLKETAKPSYPMTDFPILSIYFGRKKMSTATKRYNLKQPIISKKNEGRWVYQHLLDMFAINLSQTGQLKDKEDIIQNFDYYYDLRNELNLPPSEVLEVYKDFKDKKQEAIKEDASLERIQIC